MNPQNPYPKVCNPETSCLVVVDFQEKLCQAMPVKVIRRMEKKLLLLLHAAHLLKIPVIATLQYPKGLGQIEQAIQEKLPPQTPHIEKTSFSCHGVPQFDEFIKVIKRPQIILTGMETHICVLQTAFDLQAAGYQPWVVSDAVSSRYRDSYDYSLSRIRQGDILITETESILFEWMRDAQHPQFKEIVGLLS